MKKRIHSSILFLLLLSPLPAGAEDDALHREVQQLIGKGRGGEAVEVIERRSPADMRDADGWFLLAQAYHDWMDHAGLLRKRGLANKMRRSLEAGLAADPDLDGARQGLAELER